MQKQGKHTNVWASCLNLLKQELSDEEAHVWLGAIKPVSLHNSTLTIEVPTDYYRQVLEEKYYKNIKIVLKRYIGEDAQLNCMIKPFADQEAIITPIIDRSNPENKAIPVNVNSNAKPGALVYPGLSKVKINPRLNPIYSFANLVEGECNKLGIATAKIISQKPGRNPFNPFFVFGGSGLGKTHLVQAIGLAIKAQHENLTVLYVTSNEFKQQYINAVAVKNQLVDFLAFYMKIDVLIVDDIQGLLGTGTQGAFFNIFNELHKAGKQLIFTSDRSPAELQNFEERLLSRFKWGLSVELERPDYDVRLAALKLKAFREGLIIKEEILEYLANTIRTNFRELEGALISLMAHSTYIHREITLELAQNVVSKIVGEAKTDVNIEKIQKTVCDYFNITRDNLLSKSRKRDIVQARQIAMYLSRQYVTSLSLSNIGAELGGKDHATVLHAYNTVSDLLAIDKNVKKYVSEIENIIIQR